MSKHHAFCFTQNNWTDASVDSIKKLTYDYLLFGKELAPSTGTPHLQGYIHFKNARTIHAMKKAIPKTHLEIARGTAKQNHVYCTKDWDVFEDGTIPSQGKREDFNEMCKSVREGKLTLDDILCTNPMSIHQYGRTLKLCEDYYFRSTKRTEPTIGEWYVGKTATGKSHKAYTENPDAYDYPYDGDWMDGYRGQEVMIINDFRGELSFARILRLIDKWPCSVRMRGVQPRPFTSKKIIITSCKTPQQVFGTLDEEDDMEQLLRRVRITKF